MMSELRDVGMPTDRPSTTDKSSNGADTEPRVYYYGPAHPSHESMFLEPPEGIRFRANREPSVFEGYSTPLVYKPMRRAGVNLVGRFFRTIGSPRRVPIMARCDLVHVDGAVIPVTNKPWIVGSVEYASAFFSFDDTWSMRPSTRNSLLRLLRKPKCRKILTHSEASLNSLRLGLGSEFEAISNKTGVLPPAVPTRRLLRDPPKKSSSEPLKVLFVGNHFFDKGGRELFYAFRRLRRRYDVELVLVSAAPEHHRDYFESFSRVIKKEPGVHLHSRVPQQMLWGEFFAKSDIFCMPSYMDTFGYVLMEAMANRLPVVSSDMFAIPEIVRDGETGLLVHTPFASFERDRLRTPETVRRYREAVLDERLFAQVVDALEVSLSRLIEDDVLRRRMGEAGFGDVENGRLSVKHRNDNLRKHYSEALR